MSNYVSECSLNSAKLAFRDLCKNLTVLAASKIATAQQGGDYREMDFVESTDKVIPGFAIHFDEEDLRPMVLLAKAVVADTKITNYIGLAKIDGEYCVCFYAMGADKVLRTSTAMPIGCFAIADKLSEVASMYAI